MSPTSSWCAQNDVVVTLRCGVRSVLRAANGAEAATLRSGGRGEDGYRGRAWSVLVTTEVALALVLLLGSGLLIRSFQELRNVDPGYDTENLFTFQIAPERSDLTDGPSYARFHMDFMDRLRALPGVESVGVIENVPLNEGLATSRFVTEATAADADAGTLLNFTYAAGDYYSTMGIQVLAGRGFITEDHVSNPGNVVISQAAANLLWPGESAVGRRLRFAGGDSWETVVGVVEDIMQYGFRADHQPLVYFPLVGRTPESWAVPSPAYVVKTPRAETIAPEVRALVREVAPNAPMYRIFTMAGLAADSMVQLSFTMLTLGVTSVLALILGTVGLYGVLSYVVAQRTREIGVRMALGAEARRVRRMVVMEGARVVLVGVVTGILAALATTRVLGSLLFGVGANDAMTFVGMSGAMLVVGLLASYMPARRASNVDPIVSLRTE